MRPAVSGSGFSTCVKNKTRSLHRWCLVQVEPGMLKIDWGLYQQMIDRSLERFLSDPASPPKVFRALINRGEPVVGAENPWGVPAVELFLRTPLDTAKARRIVLPQGECDRLGLAENLDCQSRPDRGVGIDLDSRRQRSLAAVSHRDRSVFLGRVVAPLKPSPEPDRGGDFGCAGKAMG